MITVYNNTATGDALTVAGKLTSGAWISVMGPGEDELDQLAQDYNLDRDLLADAIDIYEAPRIEKDEGNVYIYTRYCYPEGREIATEPLLIIHTAEYIITVVRIDSTIFGRFISGRVPIETARRTQMTMQILEEINNSYQGQLNKVSKQILRTRAQLRQSQISNREFVGIIEIEEDLNEFLAALQPQASLLTSFNTTKYLRLHEDDREMVEDLTLETHELIELTKSRLRTLVNIRQAYDAIATNNLNQTFRRLTSIAIFLTIPTIIGGLWGMNVAVPFQHHDHAFAYVLLLIISLVVSAIWFFRHKKWL